MCAPRRRLWPVVLISSALLLLAVGAVAIGQLYWSGLHGGMARMRVSIDEASRRQVMLAEQVRAAEERLRERQAELDRREAALDAREGSHGSAESELRGYPTDTQLGSGVVVPGLVAGSPPATLGGVDRRLLHALVAGITQDVARLPPPAQRIQRGPQLGVRSAVQSGHRALRAQAQVADAALALGDPVLVDLAAAGAQRLLFELYGAGDARAQDVARQLGELRAALRTAERRMR
jgi:hypothetical protein